MYCQASSITQPPMLLAGCEGGLGTCSRYQFTYILFELPYYYCYTQIILSSAVLAGHSIERAFVVDFSLERKKIIMEKNRHILILKVNRSYNLKAGQILYFRGRIPFMNFIDMGPQKS